MLGEKFLYQRMQVRKCSSDGKHDLLFRRKMCSDFQRKNLPNLLRPCFAIYIPRLQGTIEAHTQSQRVLMLARKRDEIFITQHTAKGATGAPLASHTCPTADYQAPALMASGSTQSLRTGRKVSQSVRTLSHSWIRIP